MLDSQDNSTVFAGNFRKLCCYFKISFEENFHPSFLVINLKINQMTTQLVFDKHNDLTIKYKIIFGFGKGLLTHYKNGEPKKKTRLLVLQLFLICWYDEV